MKTDIQELIEKYYPNYSSSEEVARFNDLGKITEVDYEEGDRIHKLLIKEYGSNVHPKHPEIQSDYNELYIEILEEVIQNMNSIIEANGK